MADDFGFPDDPEELVITFDKGVPVAIDGETGTIPEAVQQLNFRAGAFGFKGRGPGASALVTAHDGLEKVCAGQISGEVRLVLHRGTVAVNSARDERTLYDFTTGATFDRSVA